MTTVLGRRATLATKNRRGRTCRERMRRAQSTSPGQSTGDHALLCPGDDSVWESIPRLCYSVLVMLLRPSSWAAACLTVAFVTKWSGAVGCAPGGASVEPIAPRATCGSKVDLLDSNSPVLGLSFDELGERTVTCSGFSVSDCDVLLKNWGCERGADAVIVTRVERQYSRSRWGGVSRHGRAIRFRSVRNGSGGI